MKAMAKLYKFWFLGTLSDVSLATNTEMPIVSLTSQLQLTGTSVGFQIQKQRTRVPTLRQN